MRRFSLNRWWALVLALSVLAAGTATLSSPCYSDGVSPIIISDGGDVSGGGGGGGGTTPRGDPDGPGGPTKSSVGGGGRAPVGRSISVVASAGDGGATMSIWTWRLHVVLKSLFRGWLPF